MGGLLYVQDLLAGLRVCFIIIMQSERYRKLLTVSGVSSFNDGTSC